MSPGCCVGVAEVGPGGLKPTPRPKFSVTSVGSSSTSGELNLPNPLANQTLHMASAEARAYNGGLGQIPQWGPGTEPLVRRSGAKLSWSCKLLSIWASKGDGKFANFSVFFRSSTTVEVVARRCNGKAFGLAISRSWVQVLLEATLRNNLRQVVYTYMPLSPSSITWYRPKGGDALRLGR